VPFPQVSDSIDNFNRADGDIGAGAGASIWDSVGWGGSGGGLVVVGNQMASGSGTQSRVTLVELPADFEFILSVLVVGGASQSQGFFFCGQNLDTGAWESYYLYYAADVGWALYKRVGGSGTPIGSSGPGWPVLVNGDKIGIHRVGDAIKIRRYTAGAWVQTPIIDVTDASIQAAGTLAFEIQGTGWRYDDLIGGAAVAEGGGGDPDPEGPTEPVTIYVDADHPDASDAHTREEAADPDTPLRTVQAAALLAYATEEWADTIQVEPAVLANALDALDTAVYARLHHRTQGGTGTDVLPMGDNAGNAPIVVKGHVVDGVMPKIAGIDGRELRNWQFEDFQQGYDRGSGDDNLTIGSLTNVEDLVFRRVKYTGGGYYVVSFTGELLWDDCEVYAPYSEFQGSGNRFLDGVGFHLIAMDTGEGVFRTGTARFTGCTFADVEGEDAIQCSLGPVDVGTGLIVEDCTFMNIIQAEGGAHTDCIQSLGGAFYTVRNSRFLNCASPFIASDDRNGTITLENNLLVGGGQQVSIQGTDTIVIRHNTFLRSVFGMSVGFGGRTAGVVQHITMVNNLMENFSLGDAIVDPDSVIENNALLSSPGFTGPYGANLPGIPELGTSARMSAIPEPTDGFGRNYELANSSPNPGIGAGLHLGGALPTDQLGRARTNPPDIGAFQSTSGTVVTPAARPPYVIARVPASESAGVSRTTHVTLTLAPRPGKHIDPDTVTEDTMYVTDPIGGVLPALSVSLSAPDADNHQVLTLDIDGTLYPLVYYTAHALSAIADTEGSHIASAQAWSFRTAGLGGPAVEDPSQNDESGFLVTFPPVPSGATISLVQGDDYAEVDDRAIGFVDLAGVWPALGGASIKIAINGPTEDIVNEFVGETKGTDQVIVELTGDQTETLEVGRGRYDLYADLPGGNRVSLVRGLIKVYPTP
jgi:hypothetical protein